MAQPRFVNDGSILPFPWSNKQVTGTGTNVPAKHTRSSNDDDATRSSSGIFVYISQESNENISKLDYGKLDVPSTKKSSIDPPSIQQRSQQQVHTRHRQDAPEASKQTQPPSRLPNPPSRDILKPRKDLMQGASPLDTRDQQRQLKFDAFMRQQGSPAEILSSELEGTPTDSPDRRRRRRRRSRSRSRTGLRSKPKSTKSSRIKKKHGPVESSIDASCLKGKVKGKGKQQRGTAKETKRTQSPSRCNSTITGFAPRVSTSNTTICYFPSFSEDLHASQGAVTFAL